MAAWAVGLVSVRPVGELVVRRNCERLKMLGVEARLVVALVVNLVVLGDGTDEKLMRNPMHIPIPAFDLNEAISLPAAGARPIPAARYRVH